MALNKPQPALGDYLLEFSREVLRTYDRPERARVETSVTLRRRFRGIGKADLLGGFMSDGSGQWLGDGTEAQIMMNMHSLGIVKQIIRANTNAMIQARVDIDIDPVSKKKSDKQGVAAVAKGCYQFFNNHPDFWSNNLEIGINQQSQTDYGYYLRVYNDPDAESPINLVVDEYSDEPIEEPGKYACPECGASGALFSAQMGNADDETIPCFKCGETAEILVMPEHSETPQFRGKAEYPAGNICLERISFYEIRVDEQKTKNGNLRKARWLEHHFLIDEDDLQAMVPYFEIGEPMEWSYPLKWQYCLETGNDRYLKSWSNDMSFSTRKQHEARRVYLRPAMYRHYVAPEDYTMDRGDGRAAVDREGNPVLSIKKGQKLIDVKPDGFWFLVANDQLLPCAETCDLRDEWSYGYYMNDSSSFHGQPAVELNELARAADNLWTIEIQNLESGSLNNLILDRNVFSEDNFEEQLSYTKEGFRLENGDALRNHFVTNPAVPTTGAMVGLQAVRSMLGDIGGPQPATLGAAQAHVAYASQALQREQSLGLLTTSLMSKAEAKACAVMQFLKHAQRTRPKEWFQYISSMYDEEWKDSDIEAFFDSNLELDLRVRYKEGSEVPTSLLQQELKTRQFILDVGELMKASKDPAFLQEQMLELLSQYGDAAQIDFDLADTEGTTRLTGVRIQRIVEWLQANHDLDMPETMVVQLAMADKSLRPMPRERHEVAIEMLMDRARALMSEQPDPDYPLISCILELIKRHEAGGVDQAQTEDANMIESKAPELAAQAAAAQAQAAGAAAAEQAKGQAEIAKEAQKAQLTAQLKQLELAAKAEEGNKQRGFDAQQAGLNREHEEARVGGELALKSAELASHPDRQAPADKVSESIAYKDIPPAAQSALLEQVGLPSSGTKEVHAANIAEKNAQAAAKSAKRPLA